MQLEPLRLPALRAFPSANFLTLMHNKNVVRYLHHQPDIVFTSKIALSSERDLTGVCRVFGIAVAHPLGGLVQQKNLWLTGKSKLEFPIAAARRATRQPTRYSALILRSKRSVKFLNSFRRNDTCANRHRPARPWLENLGCKANVFSDRKLKEEICYLVEGASPPSAWYRGRRS